MLKKWVVQILGGVIPKKKSLSPASAHVETKVSRTVGLDEEYNYADVARAIARGMSSGIPQPRKTKTFSDCVKSYGQSVWVYACVYAISNSIAGVPLRLYKRPRTKGAILEEVTDAKSNAILDLLNNPNPYMSGYDLIEGMLAGLELTGNTYIEKVMSNSGKLIELYPLQPQKIQIIPGKDIPIEGYIYDTGANKIPFEEGEIAHIKYYSPISDFYGMSPLVAGELSAQSDIYSGEWNKAFFENSARVDGVLESDNNLQDTVLKRLKAEWNKIYRGVKKSHQIAILEGGLKFRPISLSAKDMDFINMKKWTRDEICAVFGVPPSLVGVTESANYSNMESQKKMFWENTLLPKMQKIENALNLNFVTPFDKNLILKFDIDSVEALKESVEIRSRIASMLVDRGIMTQNEARERFFGLPKVTKWDADMWHMPMNLVSADKIGQEGGRPSAGEGTTKPNPTPPKPGGGPAKEFSDNPSLEVYEELMPYYEGQTKALQGIADSLGMKLEEVIEKFKNPTVNVNVNVEPLNSENFGKQLEENKDKIMEAISKTMLTRRVVTFNRDEDGSLKTAKITEEAASDTNSSM